MSPNPPFAPPPPYEARTSPLRGVSPNSCLSQTQTQLRDRLGAALTRFVHPCSHTSFQPATALVDFSHIGITESNAIDIARDALADLTSFSSIDVFVISCNAFGDSGLQHFFKAIEAVLSRVSSLEMFEVGMTDASIPMLASLLLANPNITRLKIGDNKITSVGMRLFAGLHGEKLPGLSQLHLGGNPIGDEGIVYLARAIARQSTRIGFLGLRNVEMTRKGLALLAAAFDENPTHLTELQVRDNNLSEATNELASVVRCCTSLSMLDAGNANLEEAPLLFLLEALAATPSSLKELVLSKNMFTRRVAEGLRRYLLSFNCHVATLDLCKMESMESEPLIPSDFSPIFEGVYGNRSLTGLNVSGNALCGHVAALCLGQPLRLHTLALSGCLIDSVGMSAIFDALASNVCALKTLLISNNLGGDGCVESLCRLLTFNTHLSKFEFQDNNIRSHMMQVGLAFQMGPTPLRNCRFGGQSSTANLVNPAGRQLFKDALAFGRASLTSLSILKHTHPKAFWAAQWPDSWASKDDWYRCTLNGDVRVLSPFALGL